MVCRMPRGDLMRTTATDVVASPTAANYSAVRDRTVALTGPLSAEDCCVQSMPDASPIKWHLAHTTWFFETFVLERFEANFQPFHNAFRSLFNSYYNGIGARYPRARRGMLTRPSLADILDYRSNVDARIGDLLNREPHNAALLSLVVLGLHHEQQHQELILTDIKHLLSLNPLQPDYVDDERVEHPVRVQEPVTWESFSGGMTSIGASGDGFCFDNEMPSHAELLQPYLLASRPVNNREYLEFMQSGGYADATLWLSEGWDWLQSSGTAHPLYWIPSDAGWLEFTLRGVRPLDPDIPAVHVSYFEADAFARWAGARLPTEVEWEAAAAACPLQGNFADAAIYHPLAQSSSGLRQMFGDVWEWTSSSYAPYPGYRAPAGPIGEYNGKFMVNQYVLRGGSCATPAGHIRRSYRNYFPTSSQWQFSGIRLARNEDSPR